MTSEECKPGGAEAGKRIDSASLRTIAGIGFVALLAQLGWMALNFSALPMWVEKELNQGSHLGVIMGAFMLTEALFRPTLGKLSDKIGRKILMLAGPAISSMTAVATIYVANPWLMVMLRAIDGVGLAAFWPSSFAAIGDAVDEKYRGTAMGVLNGTGMAGMALGMLFGGMANDLTAHFLKPLTGAFYFCSAIFGITVVLGLIMLPRESYKHRTAVADEHAHIPHKEELEGAVKLVPDMLILSVVIFFAMGLIMPIAKLYAYDLLGMSETQFGGMVAPLAFILGIFAVPSGHLADRWGKMVSVCYGMLLCTAAMWIIALFKYKLAMIGASAILGFGFVIAFPSWMAIISMAAPANRRGEIMGAVGLMQGVGAMLGVLVAPVIYTSDWLSLPGLGIVHYNLPFYLCAFMLTVATVMTFTWISVKRGGQSGGRQISKGERRAIVAMSLIGMLGLAAWVGVTYSRPIRPDRVTWQWMRQVVHESMNQASRFTTVDFERKGGSEEASRIYSQWVNHYKARYYLSVVRVSPDGKEAVVRVEFRFLDGRRRMHQVILRRNGSHEWRVADVLRGEEQ
jgi:DHA1 family multidrug resistance protein-like MFS transporter